MDLLLGPQHSSMGIGDLVSSFRSGTRISPARNPVHPVAPGDGGTGLLIRGTFHNAVAQGTASAAAFDVWVRDPASFIAG